MQRLRKSRPDNHPLRDDRNHVVAPLPTVDDPVVRRPALRYPVGRHTVWVARIKRFLPQRVFEQFTTRLFP
jgi:hypothetical protein